ncbi:pilin [Laceyella sacchari]|uniref:Pilin n=1 Tax=Laceyella sacchari TaxID=37482 RepID=A0ABY5U568_LACSH|nr:pilin [Laceyella sacchari]KPC73954.1 hypothetical protein ADL26_13045 [Thermoactinomyces vulgaris]TCW40652.1 hypothetical protein EDC32_101298 [Laceyella sacchari]UWE04294.1 pilin [Laceyella sacchari]
MGGTPQFVNGLQQILQSISSWMLFLVPGVIILTLVIGGLMLAKAEDGSETNAIKERMTRAIIGAALAGSATWLGNWIWKILGGGQ